MCERPPVENGIKRACRTCDACIAVRRAEWVGRGCMEKTLHKHCLVIGMTYSDDTQHTRDGAAMFRYADVREFMDRLRKAVRVVDDTARIRFMVAGEQGDRGGRCHWHAVIFSNADPVSVGVKQRMIDGRRQVCTRRSDLMTLDKVEVRVNWSIWPHGYVTFQDADEGGIRYALSYSLKDQFTGEKSRGTGRFEKSENFATGLFRVSKSPAIGEPFVWALFESWFERGVVPVSLNFKVPGLSGFYHPSGRFRKLILLSLYSLNKRILWATGADAPQWSSLVGSINPDFTSDLECLTNGKAPSESAPEWGRIDPDNFTDIGTQIDLAGREVAERGTIARFQRECGGETPCKWCLLQSDAEALAAYGLETYYDDFDGLAVRNVQTKARFFSGGRFVGRINPACRKRKTALAKKAFPSSAR